MLHDPYEAFDPYEHHASHKPSTHKRHYRNDLIPRVPDQKKKQRKDSKPLQVHKDLQKFDINHE